MVSQCSCSCDNSKHCQWRRRNENTSRGEPNSGSRPVGLGALTLAGRGKVSACTDWETLVLERIITGNCNNPIDYTLTGCDTVLLKTFVTYMAAQVKSRESLVQYHQNSSCSGSRRQSEYECYCYTITERDEKSLRN